MIKQKSAVQKGGPKTPSPVGYHKDEFVNNLQNTLNLVKGENLELCLLEGKYCDILTSKQKLITKELLELMKDCLLDQFINEPTRVGEKSKTTFDLIFTSHSDRVIQKDGLHIGINDHSMTFVI